MPDSLLTPGGNASGSAPKAMDIDTTGASASTARQDRLEITGVEASDNMVQTDDARLESESHGGAVLQDGYGDKGNAVDKRLHEPQGASNSAEDITQGGISASNAGTGNVRTYANMDKGTTGNDDADDVAAGAQCLSTDSCVPGTPALFPN